MKGVFALMIVSLIILPHTLAQNLDVGLYQEVEEFGKDFGNINAVPGETVYAFIQIENQNQDRTNDDQEIDNIEVTIQIEELLDGSDYKEDFDDFNLNPRRKKGLDFSFQVPYRVEDTSFDIIIDVEGTEDSVDFTIEEDFILTIDKDKHKVHVNKLEFAQTSVECGSTASLNMEILNIGNTDEDITIAIINSALDTQITKNVLLEKYPENDFFSTVFPIPIPEDVETGKYNFQVNLNYAELFENTAASINVVCGEPMPEEEIIEEQPEKTTPVVKQPVQTPTIVQEAPNTVVITLIILFILIAIAVVILILLKNR